jgi:hypothetical protein
MNFKDAVLKCFAYICVYIISFNPCKVQFFTGVLLATGALKKEPGVHLRFVFLGTFLVSLAYTIR